MKSIYLLIISLFLSQTLSAETIRVYKTNPAIPLLINYQTCALNRHSLVFTDCQPPIHNITIKKGQSYKDIPIPNDAFYIKIMNAYEFDSQGLIKAYGEFPGEEDCKSYLYHPATFDDKNSNQVYCLRG